MTSLALDAIPNTKPAAPYALLPPAADILESFQGAAGYHRGDRLICQWASQVMNLHRQAAITPNRLPAIIARRAALIQAIDDWTELHVLDGALSSAGIPSPGQAIDELAAAHLRAEHLSMSPDHLIAPTATVTDAHKRAAWSEVAALAVHWTALTDQTVGRSG